MVVIVVAVLAGLAWPVLGRTLEQGYLRQAQDVLQAIYSGERQYYFESESPNKEYLAIDLAAPDAEWERIGMDNPNAIEETSVDFEVLAGGLAFTAVATRVGGICDGRVLLVNQDREWFGTWLGCP